MSVNLTSLSLVLTTLFVILKLTNAVAWPWLWVLSPLWIAAALWLIFVIITLIAMLLAAVIALAINDD